MPTDDFRTDQPQPPAPHAAPYGRWPAWVVNVLFWVLGIAITWVMMAISVLILAWLFLPRTIGTTPAIPP